MNRRGASCPAADLAAVRATLRCATTAQWDSGALRTVWRQVHESWLVAKAAEIGVVPGSGFAVVATGSLGRRELLPHSDLDLLLVHDDMPPEAVGRTAGLQALQVAEVDILAALAMLDARHIAGDDRLSAGLIAGIRQQWRQGIGARYGELVDVTHARWQRSGAIAGSAEPDLKGGRGGLRDVQLLGALAVAHASGSSRPHIGGGALRVAYRTVLDVRTELHRACGRGQDLLSAQYADEVSGALGLGDRYDLAARLFDAAHTISQRVDTELRAAVQVVSRRGMSALRA